MTEDKNATFRALIKSILAGNAGELGITKAYAEGITFNFAPEDFKNGQTNHSIVLYHSILEREMPYSGDIPAFQGTIGRLLVRLTREEKPFSAEEIADLVVKAETGLGNANLVVGFTIEKGGKKLYHLGYCAADMAASRDGEEDFVIKAYKQLNQPREPIENGTGTQ